MMVSSKSILDFLRGPTFIGISVGGGIIAAYSLAGVTNVALAKIVLFVTWAVLVIEVYCSKWIRYSGGYRSIVVLIVACLSGLGFVYCANDIVVRREKQDAALAPLHRVMPDLGNTPKTLKETGKITGKRLATQPRPHQEEKSESQPILIAPSFGNIRERAISLSREIKRDLYVNGWPLPGNVQPMPGTRPMPTSIDEITLWAHFRAGTFRYRSLKNVVAIRDEFAELHIHDKDLDDILEREKQNREKYGEDFTRWPIIVPQEIQEVSDQLMMLVNEIPAKQQ